MSIEWSLESVKILVENVEKYPSLYDGLTTYNNSGPIQEIWDLIAESVGNGATGFICKRRWQVLRNAYRNHVKFGYKVSPYGIEPHLGFMRPFFRSKAELQAKNNPEDSLEYCKKLTQIVQEYPHLYFDNRSTASSDDWQEVATRMGNGDSPEQCTAHWSRLRTRYSYHLKRGYKMRPAGLEQDLKFMAPLLAAREEATLETTIMLVDLVRDHPILYQHGNVKEHQDVWKNVAEMMGSGATAQDCENHWRSLRYAYTKCLQKGFAMRQSGIAEHLEFLKPYLKLPEGADSEPAAKKISLVKKPQKWELRREAAVAAIQRHKHLKFDGEDEDTLFLFELLPDIAKMNDTDKMAFKVGAVQLAQEFVNG
ncbi:uncharacterized protein LOC120416395 [Culex pipiens pallens]|uniref:uncharacterized protein LOC120416395 n=1 Tax=Culex pipiens pallens TaxID=42434 RepID=UPI0019539AEC|nr:uncharacterized protein LOC120416395 [Culex pipiens pallens]